MKKLMLAVLVLSTLNGFAQKKSKPETYAKTITAEDLKRHLYIVAGPEMEGRETTTAGERKAAAYLENQFRSIGLEPGNKGSYQLPFEVYQDSLTNAGLVVNGKSFQLDKDFNPALGNVESYIRIGEVVVVGSAAMDTVKSSNFAGRYVLLFDNSTGGNRNQPGGNSVASAILAKGPAGIFYVTNQYPRKTPAARKSNMTLNSYRKTIAPQQFYISEEVARAIIGSDFESARSNTKDIRFYSANISMEVRKRTNALPSSNVIAVLPGTDLKDEYLFITAHYDHLGKRGDSIIYYGADDDGSGTVGILEIAEAFAKAKAAGKGPRRSIAFMAVSGEEKGLWGSSFYSENPVFPLDKTTADLNIDMIGRSDSSRKKGDSTNYVYVVGDDKLSSDLRTISESVNKKYVKLELDYKFNDPNDRNRIYYRSDHYNFARKGVPIIFYYDGMLGADYHKPTDTPDKINYKLLAKRAQLVFYTAWEMANKDTMLKRDIPLNSSVFNR